MARLKRKGASPCDWSIVSKSKRGGKGFWRKIQVYRPWHCKEFGLCSKAMKRQWKVLSKHDSEGRDGRRRCCEVLVE